MQVTLQSLGMKLEKKPEYEKGYSLSGNMAYNHGLSQADNLVLECDEVKLARLIGQYCNENSLLYDGCKGLANHILANIDKWAAIKEAGDDK